MNHDTCPHCGHPLPTPPKPKMGRPSTTTAALRAHYSDGREFTVAEAAQALGLSDDAVGSALRSMQRAGLCVRADELLLKRGRGRAEVLWRITTP